MRWTAGLFVVVLMGVVIEVYLILFVVGWKPVAIYTGGYSLPAGTLVHAGYYTVSSDRAVLTFVGRVVRVHRIHDDVLIDIALTTSLTTPLIQPMRVATAVSAVKATLFAEPVDSFFETQNYTKQQYLDMTNAATAIQPLVGSEVIVSLLIAKLTPPPGVHPNPSALRTIAQALPCNQRLSQLLTYPTGHPIACQPLISQIVYYAKQ